MPAWSNDDELTAFSETLDADFRALLLLCQDQLSSESIQVVKAHLWDREWRFAWDALNTALQASGHPNPPRVRALILSIKRRVAVGLDE